LTDIKDKIKRNKRGHRSDRIKPREHEHMLRLYADGKTISQIAGLTGRTQDTVRKHVKGSVKVKATPKQKMLSRVYHLGTSLIQLTDIPKPDTHLLPVNQEHQDEIVGAILFGNGNPYHQAIQTSMRTPWWTSTHKVNLRQYLSYEQDALLDHLFKLSQTNAISQALDEWERCAETYRSRKASGADATELVESWFAATAAARELHSQIKSVIPL
jgi:hypothetical protein